jgi:hypothetical protein
MLPCSVAQYTLYLNGYPRALEVINEQRNNKKFQVRLRDPRSLSSIDTVRGARGSQFNSFRWLSCLLPRLDPPPSPDGMLAGDESG